MWTYRIADGSRSRTLLTSGQLQDFMAWYEGLKEAGLPGLVVLGSSSTSIAVGEYKGSGWVLAQSAQLLRSVGIRHVFLVGQSFHLTDYARSIADTEYGRHSIEVIGDTSEEDAVGERLRVWDATSSQEWVQSEAACVQLLAHQRSHAKTFGYQN